MNQSINKTDYFRNDISEFIRNTGFSSADWEEYMRIGSQLNAHILYAKEVFSLDAVDSMSSLVVLNRFKEEYKELWDEVRYNRCIWIYNGFTYYRSFEKRT